MTKAVRLLPRLKYRANNHIESSAMNINIEYIRSVCVYLMRAPLTASRARASPATGAANRVNRRKTIVCGTVIFFPRDVTT